MIATSAKRHSRKLTLFLRVLISISVVLLVLQVQRGAWDSAIGTGALVLVMFGCAWAQHRGAPVGVITAIVLGCGLLTASVMAMASGRDGMSSVCWMSLAPLFGLAMGGRRAGWATLFITIACISIAMAGMEYGWVTGRMVTERTLENRLLSMLGACVAAFLLTRAYESETEGNIAALQQQNHALTEARAEAERHSRAKSDFLATISHEIRTPLNGVTGMATLLSEETDPERIRQYLDAIQQSADMLLAVINDVLDFSKIERNSMELEKVPLSPGAELRTVVELLQLKAAEAGTEIALSVTPELPEWVTGDPTRFRQILMNLASNAVKFTPHGRVMLAARVQDGQMLITVSDTGIGMSPESLERIFHPFAQGDSSTTRRFGGTGLGLVIVKRLVDAMRGSVEVQSTLGQGSTFTLELPIVPATAPERDTGKIAPVGRSKHVLVVDDNRISQVVARRTLEKMGHRVSVAHDGQEAINLALQGEFDLILLDCHMPVMDGFEATRELRRRGCRIPIIALTAAASIQDRALCLAAGMDGVLSKPVRVDQLARAISENA